MEGRSSCIFKWITNSIPRDGCLVGLRVLSPVVAQFNVLLGIVPRSPGCVQEQRHQYPRHGPEHQVRRQHLGAQQRPVGPLPHHPERHPHHNGRRHAYEARESHLPQRRPGHKADTPLVVRLGPVRHDVRILLELPPDLQDHLVGGPSHGRDSEAGEEENDHGPHESADEYLGSRDVDRLERQAGELGELVHEGAEEEEARHGGRSYGVPLGDGLGDVSGSVKPVGHVPNALGLHGHLCDSARVIGDGSVVVHGEDVDSVAEHPHGGHGGPEQAGVAAVADAGGGAEVIGE
mmetsp:Transcript_20272/g.41064  ORF Transcript_20272/g.41064 Transcript_20272/m.41064 type:complete len:291 (+) Transcript_20272:414-1286(+)